MVLFINLDLIFYKQGSYSAPVNRLELEFKTMWNMFCSAQEKKKKSKKSIVFFGIRNETQVLYS